MFIFHSDSEPNPKHKKLFNFTIFKKRDDFFMARNLNAES